MFPTMPVTFATNSVPTEFLTAKSITVLFCSLKHRNPCATLLPCCTTRLMLASPSIVGYIQSENENLVNDWLHKVASLVQSIKSLEPSSSTEPLPTLVSPPDMVIGNFAFICSFLSTNAFSLLNLFAENESSSPNCIS